MRQRGFTALILLAVILTGCIEDDMSFLSSKIEIAASPNVAEWIPRIAYNSADDEFLVVWTEQRAQEQGGTLLYNIAAQRLTSRGEKTGGVMSPAGDPTDKVILLPTPEFNQFTKEYFIGYTTIVDGFDEFGVIISNTGDIVRQPFVISSRPRNQMHTRLAFNTNRRQFLVVYNSSESGSPDIKGVIVNEDGTPVTDELMINDTQGDQYNPYVVYNPTDDRYLINWEDFRNVATWEQNGEIYGALLDGDGTVLVNDIAMIDDFGTLGEGDQRLNEITYNPDKNEYLATWSDTSPALINVGVRGRFISADGELAGPLFTVVDTCGAQIFQHTVYVPSRESYFISWEDGRNQADPSGGWRNITDLDIYGKWMSSDGTSFSKEVVFCQEPGIQRYSSLSYAEKSDRLVVAWQDIVDEYLTLGESDNQSGQHVKETGGNVYAIVYGTP